MISKKEIIDIRLIEVFLFASMAFCIASQVVSLAGGSFMPISEWTQTYFTYKTSFGQLVSLFRYAQEVCLLIVLFMALVKWGTKSPILTLACLSGFSTYLLLEIFNGYSIVDAAFGSIPVAIFLIPAFISLGMDAGLVQKIVKWSFPLSVFCFALSALITLWFRITWGWSMQFGDFPGRALYCYGICSMWIACFSPKFDGSVKKNQLLFLCLFGLFDALFLNVRSWVIQCALAFLVLYVIQVRGQATVSRTMKALVLLVIAAAAAAVLFPEAYDSFGARLGDDTRSGQYEIFFSQVEPSQLIFGGGIDASYIYGSRVDYKYFDNQLLFMAFHFGLIPALSLLYVFARSLFVRSRSFDKRGLIFVTIAWLAAIVGLSTYFSYELNYFTAVLVAVIAVGSWPNSNYKIHKKQSFVSDEGR